MLRQPNCHQHKKPKVMHTKGFNPLPEETLTCWK
jgi:hypothetical protein